MSERVEAFSGSTYPESPRAFTWQGQRYCVEEIIHRRRDPEGVGFIVRCSPENALFDLFFLSEKDQWMITPKGCIIIEESPRTKPTSQGE